LARKQTSASLTTISIKRYDGRVAAVDDETGGIAPPCAPAGDEATSIAEAESALPAAICAATTHSSMRTDSAEQDDEDAVASSHASLSDGPAAAESMTPSALIVATGGGGSPWISMFRDVAFDVPPPRTSLFEKITARIRRLCRRSTPG